MTLFDNYCVCVCTHNMHEVTHIHVHAYMLIVKEEWTDYLLEMSSVSTHICPTVKHTSRHEGILEAPV